MRTLHRARNRLVDERMALINRLRALLIERGIAIPQGRRKLEQELVILIGEKLSLGLSPCVLKLIEDMQAEWRELDHRVEDFDKEFATFAKVDEDPRHLISIPGIGGTIAPALIAATAKA